MTTDLTLNGVALSTAVPGAIVVKPIRPLVGKRRDTFVDVPGRAGSWKFPEEPGDRVLEFEIDLQGTSFENRRAQVRALADWCDLGQTANLIVSDETDRFHVAILDNDPDPDEWLLAAEAKLRFRCDPYAYAVATSSESLAASGAGSDSGSFVVPDGIYAEPVIEITPNDGTITGFVFAIDGISIAYGAPTITSGSTVTISSIEDVVTTGVSGDTMLTGAFNPGAVVMADVSGTFPILTPDDTNDWSLSWDGTATDVTIDISWRRRYR